MAEARGEFAGVLRGLRTRARLTQQELADAAGVSLRAVSDLERGVAAAPQRETVRLLADALALIGPERAGFETAARGRPLAVVPTAAAAATRSLPRDVASFIGRQRELEQLAESAMTAGGVVGIHTIGGMAGVGKTTFAVHAAHRLADRFPGGQVFLPLHGHTPGRAPVEAADALASVLLAAGVAAAQIPPGAEARAALWRDQAAGRRFLLLLDDAASSDQVRPLLPGAGGSLVLVTSRRHLSALDDATAISLDTLPPGDAAALLVRLAGRAGLRVNDPGVREMTELCGHLPLAIGMMGRQLRHHPAWSAAARAAELASARDRLELIETENLSVAAAFDLSYADLTGDQQRLFRRLGLHPGADIDAYATAALDDTGLPTARRGLEALYDQCMLTELAQGRYRLHDLLREHARALAGRVDLDEDRDMAIARLLDYYQHAAAVANVRIVRRTETRPGPDANVAAPAVLPALADQAQALAWARTERANLLACLDYAAGVGQHARVTALTAGVSGLLLRDGPWVDAIARLRTAVQVALQIGDQLSYANALSSLGDAWRLTGDYPAALKTYELALGLYRELGDRLGEANVVWNLGSVHYSTGDNPAAAQANERAFAMYRELGDRLGQARALSNLGGALQAMGDYPAAAQANERAVGMYRALGDRLGHARALVYLGALLQTTGDYPAAAQALDEALGIYRELGDRVGQANALNIFGKVWRETGDYSAAVQVLGEALDISRDLGYGIGQANALKVLGSVLGMTGDFPAAAHALDQSLRIYEDLGTRSGAAEALNDRGTLHRLNGELALARGCHQRSLELSRDIDSSPDQAAALAGLGRCALATGDAAQAAALLREALEISQRIGAAEVPELLAELVAIARPRPAE